MKYRLEVLVLPVSDVDRAKEFGDPFHSGESGQGPGVHPERIDDGSYANLEDPDGNTWLLQEVSDRD
ncbi:hypothetical protein [Serinicoccus marinus]|uniref:hypothetical protein n=1 Tax=Serinicoccus marinus TaxID=247333 RepID=UPI00248FFEBC|nr:hypothetical protein [Serinicoccus marinus]